MSESRIMPKTRDKAWHRHLVAAAVVSIAAGLPTVSAAQAAPPVDAAAQAAPPVNSAAQAAPPVNSAAGVPEAADAGDGGVPVGQEEDFPDLQARSHFRLGKQYYQQGRFAQAAAEFEIAHGLSGRDALLFNIYLAHRDAQNTRKAAAALRGYLAVTPDDPDREHLSSRLQALDTQVAEEDAAAESRAAAVAQAEREQRIAEQQRAAAEERARRIAAQRGTRPIWPWVVVGGGVVATGTGIALGILAKSDADTLEGDCVQDPRTAGAVAPLTSGTACAPAVDLDGRRSAIKTQAAVGDALWIGGALVGITGLILAYALPDEYEDVPPVTAACSLNGCDASLTLRF